MAAVIGERHRCASHECVAQNPEIRNGEDILFIVFKRDIHIFNQTCFVLAACKDRSYLETGKLSKCPCCRRNIKNFKDVPSPEIVMPIALKHYVRHRNHDEVHRLCGTRFIPVRMKDWAVSQFP